MCLNSNVYLGQVNNPSPMTPHDHVANSFINMNRTVCERVWCEGSMTAGYAVTVRAQDDADGVDDAGMRVTGKRPRCLRGWKNGHQRHQPTDPSTEESIRGGDEHIANCILWCMCCVRIMLVN